MDEFFYGDEDQNDMMEEINNYKEDLPMDALGERIKKLEDEIVCYKETIKDMQDALASAEMELDEVLDTSIDLTQLPY